MSPALQLVAFALLALALNGSMTFRILALAAAANLLAHPFLSPESYWLVFSYSSIDTVTGLLILRYADSQKAYQVTLLLTAVIIHSLMEFDLSKGTSLVFDQYSATIVGITVLQMAGAVYVGVISSLRTDDADRSERWDFLAFSYLKGKVSLWP
jgi:hypothetical protein